MRITVIGGGNIGTLMAAEISRKGHEVTICTSKAQLWKSPIEVYDIDNNFLFCSGNIKITSSYKDALSDAEIIFITLPSHLLHGAAEEILPYISAGQKIGIIPGGGGAEFSFGNIVKRGAELFCFQRVHCIARLKEYGKSVCALGRKTNVEIASIPSQSANKICKIISSFLDMPCKAMPNYLCSTMTPSNNVLHTARLYTMFSDYHEGKVYSQSCPFYEGWTDDASSVLLELDRERKAICDVLPADLSLVKSIDEHYESFTPEDMTRKIRNIPAFKGILTPMIKGEKGYTPDFQSRYFAADFSYGLKIFKDLAEVFGVKTPKINEVLNWYIKVSGVEERDMFNLRMDREQIVAIYS